MNLRTLLLLFGALTASVCALAQPEPDTSQWPDGRPGADFNVVDAKGLKQGRWIRVYPNGKLYYSGSFEDGRPVGHFTFFRETGKVLSEVQHEAGTDLAKAILYREDGTESHRGQYTTVQVDGEWTQWKTGEWTAFDKQGRIRMVEHYTRDSLDGDFSALHRSGQLLEEGRYAMGAKQGTWKAYDREGRLRAEEVWRNGRRNGPSRVMQDGGALLSEGQYQEDLPVGEWTLYNPDGKVRSLIAHEGGKVVSETPQNGEFSADYPSGRPHWVGRYAHGRLDGPYTAWHDRGEWTMVPAETGNGGGMPPGMAGPGRGRPGGGRPGAGDAPMRRELRNQPMKEVGEYTAGVKDGTWRYFDEQGQPLRTERWNLGRLESTEE